MKNTERLQEAFGAIDDELILDAKKPRNNKRLLRIIALSAACFIIVLSILTPLIIGETEYLPSRSSGEYIPPDEDDYTPKYVENLWSRSDFSALSIVYGSNKRLRPVNNTVSDGNFTSETAIESEQIKVNLDSTINVESLLADRYVIYYSDIGYPIIYDIKEGKAVDLTERIIGTERADGEAVYKAVMEKAEEGYKGITATQNNRDMIHTMVMSWMSTEVYDESAFKPDIDFLKDHEVYGQLYEVYMPFHPEDLYYIFFDAIWVAYCEIPRDDYNQKPYSIAPVWIDSEHGLSIVKICNVSGSTIKTVVYNIVEDKVIEVPMNDWILFTDGYEINFSSDGSFFTITNPRGGINGANIPHELQSRYSENEHRTVSDYRGENYSVVYIDNYQFVALTDFYGTESFGCSKAYISENGSVIYYKLMNSESAGKNFNCDKEIWYNRLARFDSDNDSWTFCTVDGERANKVVLDGRFVKLACNETVAIMEREGLYYAYLIENGRDITSDIFDEKYGLLAHERLIVYYENNALHKKDIFNGKSEKIIDCDSYILSSDGAFAFVYKNGDSFVTCINVATGESRRITVGNELLNQIFADKNAVFKMNYSEKENTLTLSFYKSDEVQPTEETKDFYSLISEINNDSLQFYEASECGKVIENIQIDKAVLEAIRQYAIDYKTVDWGHDPSVLYPLGFTPQDKHQDVLRKLGVTPPDDYIDMNGTCFVLYKDEDESIEFFIDKYMPIYDPPEDYFNNGLCIIYKKDGRIYDLI